MSMTFAGRLSLYAGMKTSGIDSDKSASKPPDNPMLWNIFVGNPEIECVKFVLVNEMDFFFRHFATSDSHFASISIHTIWECASRFLVEVFNLRYAIVDFPPIIICSDETWGWSV